MKQKYTYARVSLFIGLLSFHSLSSCVRTSQIGQNIENAPKRYSNIHYSSLSQGNREACHNTSIAVHDGSCDDEKTITRITRTLWAMVFWAAYIWLLRKMWSTFTTSSAFNETRGSSEPEPFQTAAWNGSRPSITQ